MDALADFLWTGRQPQRTAAAPTRIWQLAVSGGPYTTPPQSRHVQVVCPPRHVLHGWCRRASRPAVRDDRAGSSAVAASSTNHRCSGPARRLRACHQSSTRRRLLNVTKPSTTPAPTNGSSVANGPAGLASRAWRAVGQVIRAGRLVLLAIRDS